MVRKRLLPLLLIFAVLAMLLLVSCDGNAYRVNFYDGENLVYSFAVKKGGELEEIPDVPYKEGKIGTWSVTDFDEVNSDITVYAIYSDAQYSIRFFVDNELKYERKVNKRSGLSDVPAVPQKVGYRAQWSVTDFSVVNRDLDVYAVYTPIDSSVSFSVNGEIVATRYVTTGSDLTSVPEVPAYPNKNYSAKWVADADSLTEADFTNVTGDVTVYAYYYLTIATVGGDEESFDCEIGKEVDSPVVGRKVGYDFVGWYRDADFTDKIAFPITFTENTTIYTRWLSAAGDTGFTFDNGTLTGYTGSKTEIIVPYKYTDGDDEIIVTKIADRAFYDTDITKITLPSTISEIGSEAFRGCSDLTDLVFADGSFIEKIGQEAFLGCSLLKSFEFSHFTSEIGARAFNNCSSVTSYLGLEQTAISVVNNAAFFGNNSVTSFRLPASVEEIANYAFGYCSSARFVFADASNISKVGEGAFTDCVYLTDFTSSGLTSVGAGAFAGCYSLTAVTMVSDNPLFFEFGTASCDNSYVVTYDAHNYYIPSSLSQVTVTPNLRTGLNAAGTVVTDSLYNCASVKNVIVSEGIKVLNERAFRSETELSSDAFTISLPTTLLEIGVSAFEGRYDIKQISLPSNLESISDYAFYNLNNLASIAIASNNALASVGKYTFTGSKWFDEYRGVVRLGRVALGISVNYIASVGKSSLDETDFVGIDSVADYAFANNGRLSKVTLPENVIDVGDGAFAQCSALKEISFGVTCTVGEGALKGCYGLEKITIGLSKTVEELFGQEADVNMTTYQKDAETYYISPLFKSLTLLADTVTTVEKGIYVDFAALETITLGEGITAVESGAFTNNVSLKEVDLPASLISIGYYEGYDANLEERSYNEIMTEADIDAFGLLVADDVDAPGVFAGDHALHFVRVATGSNLTTIYPKAFIDTGLTSFDVPASVTKICAFAFADTPLTSLTFNSGDNALDIGLYSFGVDAIADTFTNYTLTMPSNLRRISAMAFISRSGISNVNFNNGLSSIGMGAFAETGITKLTLPADVSLYSSYCTTDAVLDPNTGAEITPAVIDKYGIFESSPIIELTLNSSVAGIDIFGFDPLVRVATININGGDIGERQFTGFASVTSLNMHNVTKIGKEAFLDCSGLLRITVPATVTEIGDKAFAGCTSLISLVYDNGSVLSSIGKELFAGDTSLRSTFFPDTVTSTLFEGVFNNCSALIETNIPESVMAVGDYAFNGCASLKSITIPEGVTTIGGHAFNGCVNLEFENIKFDRLTSLGDSAFASCALLHGVKAENISEIGDNAFDGCNNLKEITIIDKKVSEYISSVNNVVTVNVSSVANGIAAEAFDGCASLALIMIYAEANLNAILGAIDVAAIPDAKIFVTGEGYETVSNEIKSTFAGKLYINPTEIDATYEYEDDGTATITGINNFNEKVLFLPTYVIKDNVTYTVTAIGDSALTGNDDIEELIVPFTVETIGNNAFKQCAALTTVRFEIGSKLHTIGTNAFYQCTSLASISLPDSLVSIGDRAFYQDTALTTVESTIYSKLSHIGNFAFFETGLTGITFNGPIESIGNSAFEGSQISAINFGANVEISEITAGTRCFAYCYQLSDETINSIKSSGFVFDETTFYR